MTVGLFCFVFFFLSNLSMGYSKCNHLKQTVGKCWGKCVIRWDMEGRTKESKALNVWLTESVV